MPMKPTFVPLPHASIKDSRQTAHARGYDRTWQILRYRYLSAHPVCTFCHRPATVVDHIQPLASGGARLEESNLRPVCVDCHAKLTTNFKRFGVNEMDVPTAVRSTAKGQGVV